MSDWTRREFGYTLGGAVGIAGYRRAPQPSKPGGSLTDVPGVQVGHATDSRRPTGCTAILFDPAAAAGVDYNGSAPGESQGVLLQPVSPVDRIHGLFFTGGGVLALPASSGVLRYLEERKIGFDWGTPDLRIPIVVSAVIDELAVGNPRIRPDEDALLSGLFFCFVGGRCRGQRRRGCRRDGRQDAPRQGFQRDEGRRWGPRA